MASPSSGAPAPDPTATSPGVPAAPTAQPQANPSPIANKQPFALGFWESLLQVLSDGVESIPPDVYWGGMSIALAILLAGILTVLFPDQFGDIFDWVKLVGHEWWLSMTGIVNVLLAIIGRFRKNKEASAVLFALGVWFLLIASYQAWHEERKTMQAKITAGQAIIDQYKDEVKTLRISQASLDAFEVPKFSLILRETEVVGAKSPTDCSSYAFIVEVLNHGGAGIGRIRNVSLEFTSGQNVSLPMEVVQDGFQIFRQNVPLYAFYQSDFLGEKLSRPIDRNGSVIGYVWVNVPLSFKGQSLKGLHMTIIDVNDKEYALDSDVAGTFRSFATHFPGTSLNKTHAP